MYILEKSDDLQLRIFVVQAPLMRAYTTCTDASSQVSCRHPLGMITPVFNSSVIFLDCSYNICFSFLLVLFLDYFQW